MARGLSLQHPACSTQSKAANKVRNSSGSKNARCALFLLTSALVIARIGYVDDVCRESITILKTRTAHPYLYFCRLPGINLPRANKDRTNREARVATDCIRRVLDGCDCISCSVASSARTRPAKV